MSAKPGPQLQAALAAAAAAADIIRAGYGSDFTVTTKADRTPVTEVDIEAERAIRTVLQEAFPDYGFYGEETGRAERDSEYLWLVDPIDGTKAFVRGYPYFSTQIALAHAGDLILGVSSAPVANEIAHAERGGGAWLNGAPLRVSTLTAVADAAISLGNVHTLAAAAARWQQLGAIVAECSRIRGYGDYLHYHLLAAGKIDAVVESDVNILDIAALSVIVTEAGGAFTDLDGRAPGLATTTVLAANPALHATLLQRLS